MLTKVNTIKLQGIDGIPVTCEVSVENGIGIHLVGLADAAVKESLLRTVTALQATGYRIPGKKIIINLAPADLVKQGSGYDLPIAVGLIAASGQEPLPGLQGWLLLGELGLDGSLREVPGCVQAVETAAVSGFEGVVIPKANAAELSNIFTRNDIPVYGAATLDEAVRAVEGEGVPTIWDDPSGEEAGTPETEAPSWDRAVLTDGVKRALEIAAAGGHHLLLCGAPGSGRATAARSLMDILPPMTREETLSAARIWSAARRGTGFARSGETRPFRAPHYSASLTALLGGGTGGAILPGEVSLASEGVLYLDDLACTPKQVLEALRGPLEDREVTISRLRSRVRMPARFQLVAATTLCPCGYYGEGDRCTCSSGQRAAFLSRLSGPVMDRIDLQVFCHGTTHATENDAVRNGENAASVAERVRAARAVQRSRFGDGRLNADMAAEETIRHADLGKDERETLEKIITHLGLSVRAYIRVLKIARTIADLDGRQRIRTTDLAEASSYRFLDRTPSGNE